MRLLAVVVAVTLGLAGCAGTGDKDEPAENAAGCRALTEDPAWYGDNRDRIDAMMADIGKCGDMRTYNKGAPLALFDWDNTIVKNDVGDAMVFWLLRNGKVRQPANGDWSTTSPFLTPQAAQALAAACNKLGPPGAPLPTNTDTGCADEILSVYSDAETRAGEPAFAGFNARRMEPSYAWAAQLLAGWNDAQVADFAMAAKQENLAAPEGAEQTVGTHHVTGWVRYYPQMQDLVHTLYANGFDVRVISASAEPVVRVWAQDMGIPAERVMGVRTGYDGDVLSSRLFPCGGEPAIPYIEGKRCRVNEDLFGMRGPEAFEPVREQRRAAFAAGDSDTDVTFLSDATRLRLVLNRNKTEVMCRAYDNADGKWLVNPMFMAPLEQAEPYACATAGFVQPDGTDGPLHRADGSVVPDQQDRVH